MAEEKKKPEAEKTPAAAPAKDKEKGHGAAAPAEGDGHAAKGGMGALLAKTPVILAAVMLIEAVVLFAGFKFLGSGARAAKGAELITAADVDAAKAEGEGKKDGAATEPSAHGKTTELPVVDFRAPNKVDGRTFLYDVSIFALVKTAQGDAVKQQLTDNENLIKDRIRTIIAQSDPDKLGGGSEPGLETLRRQIQYQLDQIIGPGQIDEVLVPRCIPFRTDY